MIIKIERLPLIIFILIIVLFVPAYFGLYEPFIESQSQNAPLWFNIIIILASILTFAVLIMSFFYYIEISDTGITQHTTMRHRTLKWQDIRGWGYYYGPGTEGTEEDIIIFLELITDNKRELIRTAYLDKNLHIIKMELEKRLGEAIFTTKQCKC